jgi:hypothetical protein
MSEIEKPSAGEAVVRVALDLVPVVGGAFAAAWDYSLALDRWRIGQIAGEAASTFGDDERLAQRLLSNERFTDLLVVAVEAGRRTSWEAKRITMGRVLGHAMTDDADIDDHAALLMALAVLEAVHFHYLGRIAVEASTPPLGHVVPEPYRAQLVAQGVVAMTPVWDDTDQITGVSHFGTQLMAWIRDAETQLSTRDPHPLGVVSNERPERN